MFPIPVNVKEEPKHNHSHTQKSRNMHYIGTIHVVGQLQTIKISRNYAVVYITGWLILLIHRESQWIIKRWNGYGDAYNTLVYIIMKGLQREQDYYKTVTIPLDFTHYSPGALENIPVRCVPLNSFIKQMFA